MKSDILTISDKITAQHGTSVLANNPDFIVSEIHAEGLTTIEVRATDSNKLWFEALITDSSDAVILLKAVAFDNKNGRLTIKKNCPHNLPINPVTFTQIMSC